MNSTVVSFDFKELTRLAKEDPAGFAHRRESLIRQLIDRAPRTEHLTELEIALDQARHQMIASGLQLGFHITIVMVLPFIFMAAYAATPNRSAPASESSAPFHSDRFRPHE